MTTVVKVGGSLFDLPDLSGRLKAVLRDMTDPVLIVAGGGPAADVVREYDRIHRLGEEAAHWLALRACSLNAHLLARLLDLPVVSDVPANEPRAIVDLLAFAIAEESRDPFPHRWDVSSDSMAVCVARRAEASALILLKSTLKSVTGNEDIVDPFFPAALERAPNLAVAYRNLRAS